MSTSHFDREVRSRVTHVQGGDVAELIRAAEKYLSPGSTWEADRGVVTFVKPGVTIDLMRDNANA